MTGRPRVSIAIITYNQEAYVAETVLSAVEQDWDDLEVVVSDDASTDGTRDILRELATKHPGRLKLVLPERNHGITGNSNLALNACSGSLVAFQGGDDVLLPGKVRAQVDWFGADETRVVCYHDVDCFDSTSGRTLYRFSSIAPQRAGRGPRELIEHGNFMPATSVMVRRKAVPPGGFDGRLPRVSDYKLWIDCLARGGAFGAVPGVLARYRLHGGNVTTLQADAVWTEALMTLALTEAAHPALSRSCEHGRAHFFRQRAVRLLSEERGDEARELLEAAVLASPRRSARALQWWLLSFVPKAVREQVVATRFALGRRGG